MLKRLRNKYFVASCIGFIALVYKTVTGTELPGNINTIVDVTLTLLTTIGVVIDPTTPGITDGGEK